MEITAVIPARYKSTRFPGKPLAEIAGRPMIEHVYTQVKKVKALSSVIVATDDTRIYNSVLNFGGRAVMTSPDHTSGTDRVAEVAEGISADVIINVQGDEPLIAPEMISTAVQPFYKDEGLKMSTLKKRIDNTEEIENPNVVKVVTDSNDYALYFSRSPVPYPNNKNVEYYKHIGLYVYRSDFLLNFCQMEPTFLEKTESLEQLRVLENGYKIKVIETEYNTVGVDEPEDIKKVEEILSREAEIYRGVLNYGQANQTK